MRTGRTNNIGEGSLYTMMQQWQTMKTLHTQNPAALSEIFASAAKAETFTDFVAAWAEATTAYQPHTKQHTDKSVAQWPALALAWLDKIGG